MYKYRHHAGTLLCSSNRYLRKPFPGKQLAKALPHLPSSQALLKERASHNYFGHRRLFLRTLPVIDCSNTSIKDRRNAVVVYAARARQTATKCARRPAVDRAQAKIDESVDKGFVSWSCSIVLTKTCWTVVLYLVRIVALLQFCQGFALYCF